MIKLIYRATMDYDVYHTEKFGPLSV